MRDITGVIRDFSFIKDGGGFGVADFQIIGGDEIKISGEISEFKKGDFLTLTCQEKMHPKFGKQYIVKDASYSLPYGLESIRYYISSKFHGIGEVSSTAIVNYFGDDVLDILDKNPEAIRSVPGLKANQKNSIAGSWERVRKKEKVSRTLFMALRESGLGIKKINNILKVILIAIKEEQVLKDPYAILDLNLVSFQIVDTFALTLGIEYSDPRRMYYAVKYYSSDLIQQGDCYISERELVTKIQSTIYDDQELIYHSIDKNIESKDIVLLEKEGEKYYMPFLYHKAEENIANSVYSMSHSKSFMYRKDFGIVKEKEGISLNEEQVEAVENALKRNFYIITGGPGTGKTTILKEILNIAKRKVNMEDIALLAPTGKAAKRITQTTGEEARTIHRALALTEGQTMQEKIIIIDESSMMDIILFNEILESVTPEHIIILIGDFDQLASIGPGQMLKDIIDSDKIPYSKLKHVYRFEEGLLRKNSHKINNGEFPELPEKGDPYSDFYFLQYSNRNISREAYTNKLVDAIIKIYTESIPKAKGIDVFGDIQLISPMRKHMLGVDSLNLKIRDVINPIKNKEDVFYYNNFENNLRINDKVMQTENNYNKGVYNGDTGIVRKIDQKRKMLYVDFEGELVEYTLDDINQLDLSYANTVHKTQGSEYDYVIIIADMSHKNMLTRDIFYTGVTRAKKMVMLVGSHEALEIAIKNNESKNRKTALKDKIIKLSQE